MISHEDPNDLIESVTAEIEAIIQEEISSQFNSNPGEVVTEPTDEPEKAELKVEEVSAVTASISENVEIQNEIHLEDSTEATEKTSETTTLETNLTLNSVTTETVEPVNHDLNYVEYTVKIDTPVIEENTVEVKELNENFSPNFITIESILNDPPIDEFDGPRGKHLKQALRKALNNTAKSCSGDKLESCFPFNLKANQFSQIKSTIISTFKSVIDGVQEPFDTFLKNEKLIEKLNKVDEFTRSRVPGTCERSEAAIISSLTPQNLIDRKLYHSKLSALAALEKFTQKLEIENSFLSSELNNRQTEFADRLDRLKSSQQLLDAALDQISTISMDDLENDYRILYEVLKEKTIFLEKTWKATLTQLKESLQTPKEKSALSESFSVSEIGRASTGRRINPTLLKNEPTVPTNLNPFISSSISNESDSKDIFLNRPVGKHVQESAWKKIPQIPVVKVGEALNSEFESAKLEYVVYLKQGISLSQQEMIKKLSEAYYDIVFDEINVDFSSFTESFGIILRILSVGHELFNLNTFSKMVVENFLLQSLPKDSHLMDSSIFQTPIEMFLFSVQWVQISRDRLITLLPDSSKCFEKNLLIEAVDPSLCQFFKNNYKREEISLNPLNSGSGLSLHSLLPVAYSNQRDSKKFLRDPNAHANQQKIRDLFINLIRQFSTNQLDTSNPTFNRHFTARVSELMTKVNSDNYAWLADLYIQEYEQAADFRLDRLEERMASRRSSSSNICTTFSLDQIFFMFLQYADSFRLTKAIEKKTIAMISVSLEQANNSHKRSLWSECIKKLRSIIKLLAFCRYKLNELLCLDDGNNDAVVVEEEDVIIYSWTQDAILNKQLLTLLPLIYEYFTFIGNESIKSRCSNTVKLLLRYYQVKFEIKRKKTKIPSRAKLLLKLSLEDIFRETLNPDFYSECAVYMSILNEEYKEITTDEDEEKRISKFDKQENNVLARPIDEDEVLPSSISSVYRSISSQMRSIYLQLNSICMNANHSTEFNRNISSDSAALTESTPRKVRPVTQVPAADLKQQKIQKQLRQWFWWRYGSQKDLVDALNSYILEQMLFPQFPISANSDRLKNAEDCKEMYKDLIFKVLPVLLPRFWHDKPELIEIILNLSFEVASKAIKHHFS